MRKLALQLLPLTAFWVAQTSWAVDASRCYSIKDSDQRHACLAYTKQSSSQCYSIKEPDSRRLCFAQVSGDRSNCYSIREQDLRNACLAGQFIHK